MSRPDQSITFLRSFGFSVYRFPRALAQPLELMHREGKDLTRLGLVEDLVTAGAAGLPTVRRDDRPGIDIEGKETSKVNVAIGRSISAEHDANISSRVVFEGSVPIAFAFQAVQLVFDVSGEFLTTQQLPSGDAAARAVRPAASPSDRGPVFLEARGALVRVSS